MFDNSKDDLSSLYGLCRSLGHLESSSGLMGVQLLNQISIQTLLTLAYSIPFSIGQHKARDVVVMMVFWYIWNFRNSPIFGMAIPRKSFIF